MRIAHLTDIHVQPELSAAKGFEKCLEHAQSQKPDALFLGGDYVMDSLEASPERLKVQWDLFCDVLKANVSKPTHIALGNHDVWGWGQPDKYRKEAKYGKVYAMERLQLTTRYRSFDQAGWHFILLDSTHQVNGIGYQAKLDEEQFAWLEKDLKETPADRPVLVLSHIPILGVCPYLDGDNEQGGNWVVPGAWMHYDARRIKDLFYKHKNVKACLSGHIHLADRAEYLGVSYFCNGATCGGWWGGPYQECDSGYAIVDLYNDGTVENRYVNYGWKPA